jgi:hypothetical protein
MAVVIHIEQIRVVATRALTSRVGLLNTNHCGFTTNIKRIKATEAGRNMMNDLESKCVE